MSRNIEEDKDYICSLEHKYVKKAKDELFENPEDRLAAVQALREWIKQQPHIKCPKTDTVTLLSFLRWAKWSQIRARERVEAFLSLASIMPTVYSNLDTTDEIAVKLLQDGANIILPHRDLNGCKVLLSRAESLKLPYKFPEYFRVMAILANYMLKSEETQVNGVVIVCDFTGLNATCLAKVMGTEAGKIQKTWVNTMPLRFKAINFYRAGLFIETLAAFAKTILPKKLAGRIKVHETMESLYEVIPMECLPAEYLPDDYSGPNAGTSREIRENFISAIQEKEFRDELLYKSSNSFGVDESKKPKETVTQHFRKLNID